jgi:hypothetical protein
MIPDASAVEMGRNAPVVNAKVLIIATPIRAGVIIDFISMCVFPVRANPKIVWKSSSSL